MKNSEVLTLIKKIHGLQSRKFEQAQNMLVNFVLEETSMKQVISRVDLVADALWEVRSQGKEKCEKVFKSLVDAFFSRGKHALLLEYYKHIQVEDLIKSKKLENYTEGRNLFLLNFFEILGNSTEYTIVFCLYLFELFHDLFEKNNDGRIPPSDELLDSGALPAHVFLLNSVTFPKRKELPISLWFHNIVENAQTNKAAFELFRNIVSALTDGGNMSIQVLNMEDTSLDECLDLHQELIGSSVKPTLVASSFNEATLISHLLEKLTRQGSARMLEAEKLLAWFNKNREFIENDKVRKSLEILEKPARGLRSDGADHIKISVSTLYAAGVHAVVFCPNGCKFPDLKLKVMASKWTPHLVAFDGALEDFRLNLADIAVCNSKFNDNKLLKSMLEYLIIDAIHRIVVVQKQQVNGSQKRRDKSDVCERNRATEVRPHFRTLPDGWKPSEEARERAQIQHGWTLPAGKTFVKAHYRNGNIEFDMETEPIMIYDDDFLMSLV